MTTVATAAILCAIDMAPDWAINLAPDLECVDCNVTCRSSVAALETVTASCNTIVSMTFFLTSRKKYVNMADINSTNSSPIPPGRNERGDGEGDSDRFIDLIELLFFAYRDFTSDPDAILSRYGFGRAHHRVLHFVDRNPGLTVADLLSILNITKQSLARVLKQLVDSDFIEQRTGASDRRQRLLYTTAEGQLLNRQLSEPQSRRIRNAFRDLDPEARGIVADFLFQMIDEAEQQNVRRLTGKE